MATKNNSNQLQPSEWAINTDIYDIVKSVEEIKKRYIDDEDETTLALGIYGYLTDTEAKKIQTAVIMTGELGNEMFPARAKLTKNVLAHAIYTNISDINAVPAHMMVNIGIKVDDLDTYMENGRFVFDCECPIFIGSYEFHFDYDIILQKSKQFKDVYSAHYDMTNSNPVSNIANPYLKQPFVIKIGNFNYVVFQTLIRQYSIEETSDIIISDSIIENKTYTFEFSNQLADFDVYITDNGKTTRLKPLMYGSSNDDIENYCWYLYISDNVIRIAFDSKSFIPGLNSEILIKAYTTLGSSGIFSYKKIDSTEEGLFVDFSSTKYNYSKLTCYLIAGTDSVDGMNRKTKEELQKLIPKAALSRGSLTTETDVQNYFNLLDSPDNRLVVQKKVDNQLSRIWYGYFMLKDEVNNIIPTNTIKIQVNTLDGSMIRSEDGRYILPAGTILKYNAESKIAVVVDETEVPDLFGPDYFNDKDYYYMTVYSLLVCPDPLYAAFYLTISDMDSFFIFNWINEDSVVQFVTNRCNFQRKLLTDQSTYTFTFKTAQSISTNLGLYVEEIVNETNDEGENVKKTIITNNLKCVLVLYREDRPYRWVEATLVDYDFSRYIASWEINMETDNGFDDQNRIKIEDLHVAYTEKDISYGYFDPTTKAVLYIMAKFDTKYVEKGSYGRYDLDEIAPGFDDYTVTNIYEVNEGLTFYENFTNILNTKINIPNDRFQNECTITGVPVVGLHYMTSELQSSYLVDELYERKAYIDYCLMLLENNMDLDFKFFNTYGPSVTYSIGDKQNTLIGHVDLNLRLRVSVKSTSDIYTKDDIIKFIKDYIEDLYDTGDWHAPNMITELENEFSDRCNFIEFMNYNDFWLGVQHIIKMEVDDPHIVPEFLNIRNRYNNEGLLEPCIDIEILTT